MNYLMWGTMNRLCSDYLDHKPIEKMMAFAFAVDMAWSYKTTIGLGDKVRPADLKRDIRSQSVAFTMKGFAKTGYRDYSGHCLKGCKSSEIPFYVNKFTWSWFPVRKQEAR